MSEQCEGVSRQQSGGQKCKTKDGSQHCGTDHESATGVLAEDLIIGQVLVLYCIFGGVSCRQGIFNEDHVFFHHFVLLCRRNGSLHIMGKVKLCFFESRQSIPDKKVSRHRREACKYNFRTTPGVMCQSLPIAQGRQ